MATKSSTSPELPPEIIRHVLRFFSHDRESLRNCALVSQDWLFESRSFLFRNIDIVYWGPYDHFVSNFLRSHRLRPWLTSIHHLSFGFMPSTTRQQTFISDISERLSNLRTMKWAYFPPDLEDDRHLRPEVFPALGKFARLHHLELNDCDFASFEDLKKVVAAFPSLSSLTLYRVEWDKSSNADGPSPAQLWPVRLSKITFVTFYPHNATFVDDVLLWLCASPSRHLLEELSFDLCNTPAALRLTLACTSLTTLHIRTYENHEILGDDAQAAHLHHLLSRVRHIELLRLEVLAEPESWDAVARLLELFRAASSVRRIRLCCTFGNSLASIVPPNTFDDVFDAPAAARAETALLAEAEADWGSQADRTCAAFRTQGARAVQFAWYYDCGDDAEMMRDQHAEHEAWVARAFPRLRERDLVGVYTYSDTHVLGPEGVREHNGGADFPHDRSRFMPWP